MDRLHATHKSKVVTCTRFPCLLPCKREVYLSLDVIFERVILNWILITLYSNWQWRHKVVRFDLNLWTGMARKRSFIPTVRLLSTLIYQENGTIRKRSSNRSKLNTPRVRFSVDGEQYEKRTFRKRLLDYLMNWWLDDLWFPGPSFL